LYCYSDGKLADGRTTLRTEAATRPVDVRHEIQLLGDPGQGAHISNGAGAYRARGTEIGDRWRFRRSKHDLACDRSAAG